MFELAIISDFDARAETELDSSLVGLETELLLATQVGIVELGATGKSALCFSCDGGDENVSTAADI
jgi:hypothetical protein